ncbi:Crp/Fnr family transcriptional regulator [Paractinoplanes atraurantiacus]|uniref:cAMP-binding domain of CRP or a regulatory subunit of cAMP-dependent protein kinases n=1 Tax=Paractinoplanes atraurantiacus TaxID=1036182 RepID=A0A285FVN5_9ACTN|nr:Crp/Fnr family transcriptional regulator [Actinoplanes atraurantiacus]SNY15198.1 cAMP-binding domain of CRP or a regulatory subunit of cAMP-dependent protein kinases [Actinoplanes atraurantiacus]
MVDLLSLNLETPLTKEELTSLEASGTGLISRPAGTLLIGEGEVTDDHALLIRKGVVKVLAGSPRRIVYLRGPGQMVGEMAAIRRKPRSASVVALTEVQALHISGARWVQFLVEQPRAALAQIYALDERLAEATRKNVDSFLAAERKFAKSLLELHAMGVGEVTQAGVQLRFSQRDIAEIAGISRESAKDTIGLLKARGVIQTGRSTLTIRDMAAIEAISLGHATA